MQNISEFKQPQRWIARVIFGQVTHVEIMFAHVAWVLALGFRGGRGSTSCDGQTTAQQQLASQRWLTKKMGINATNPPPPLLLASKG